MSPTGAQQNKPQTAEMYEQMDPKVIENFM